MEISKTLTYDIHPGGDCIYFIDVSLDKDHLGSDSTLLRCRHDTKGTEWYMFEPHESIKIPVPDFTKLSEEELFQVSLVHNFCVSFEYLTAVQISVYNNVYREGLRYESDSLHKDFLLGVSYYECN